MYFKSHSTLLLCFYLILSQHLDLLTYLHYLCPSFFLAFPTFHLDHFSSAWGVFVSTSFFFFSTGDTFSQLLCLCKCVENIFIQEGCFPELQYAGLANISFSIDELSSLVLLVFFAPVENSVVNQLLLLRN